jgi:prepilin-type N-terminal cleavage/methylation domain-containing protein
VKPGAPPSTQTGFTLLEVLVALAILGVAIVASIQGFAAGLRLLKLSGEHQRAMLLADQKLRETATLQEGRETGTEGALTWERAISIVETPELTAAGSFKAAGTALPGAKGSSTATTGASTGLTGSSTAATATPTAAGLSTGAGGASTSAATPTWRMYRVDLKVQWEKRSVELSTLRTVLLDATGTPQTGTESKGTPLATSPQVNLPPTGTSQPGLPTR